MLRTSILIILSLAILAGCRTDITVPCDKEDGPSGQLCRAYLYLNDEILGFADYEHQADSIRIIRYYDPASALKKTVTERYEHGRISIETARYENWEPKVVSYHYNEMDSLYSIVYGANDSATTVSYTDGKRDRVEVRLSGVLDRYHTYRYYQDDGKLYRTRHYNANDSLLSYRQYEYYSTGQQRVSFYSPDHVLKGRRVYSFSLEGLITSIEFTDTSGTVTARSTYTYDSALNLTEKVETELEQTRRSAFLYY